MAWVRRGSSAHYAVPAPSGFSDEPMPRTMPEFTEESLAPVSSSCTGEDTYKKAAIKPADSRPFTCSTGASMYTIEMVAEDICTRLAICQEAVHAEVLKHVGAKLKQQEAIIRDIIIETLVAFNMGIMEESVAVGASVGEDQQPHSHNFRVPLGLVLANVTKSAEESPMLGAPSGPNTPAMTPIRHSSRSCPPSATRQGPPEPIGGRSVPRRTGSFMDGGRRKNMSPALIDADRRKAAVAVTLSRCSTVNNVETGAGSRPPGFLRVLMQELVASRGFELCVFLVISSNVVLVGMETDYNATHQLDAQKATAFRAADYFYTLFFLLEMLIRMVAEGGGFFFSGNWAWNTFDLLVFMSSLAETVLSLLEDFGQGVDLKHMRILRALRVVRLTRALRMARLVKFIRSLRTLILSILVTIRSLIWALLLLIMFFYGFGIALTQAVTSYRYSDDVEDSEIATLEMFWGTLPRSMFTLFKAVTGGVSWHEVVHPLSSVSGVSVTIFIAYIVFNVFAVMNVITGAFCQSAIEAAQSDKEYATSELLANKQRFTEDMQGLFATLDSNNSGMIDVQEFETHLQDDKLRAYFALLDIDTTDAWTLFKLLDCDETGEIDVCEFVSGCLELRGHAKAIHVAKMSKDNSLFRHEVTEMMDSVSSQLGALIAWAGLPPEAGTACDSETFGCASSPECCDV